MKHTLSYIALFICVAIGHGQGVAAEIAKHIATSTAAETTTLTATRASQMQVLGYSKKIAKNTLAIAALKEAELNSLNSVPDRLSETSEYKYTFRALEYLVRINTNTIQILEEYPQIESISMLEAAELIQHTYGFIMDAEQILNAGNDNLMTPTSRFELLMKINKRLGKLVQISDYVNMWARSSAIAYSVPGPLDYNFSQDVIDIQNMLETIIIE